MSDLNEALADVKQEGDLDPFAALEKDIPSESPTENEPEVEEPVEGDNTPDEDNVPFHKNPRWQQMQEKAAKVDTLEAELAELREAVESRREPQDESIPQHFVELYGDNPLAYRKWKEYEDTRKEETKREVIDELRRAEQEAQEESQRWLNWVDESLEALKSAGHDFDRNELIKTMLDYKPTDSEGNFDFEAGYRIYEALKQPKEDTTAKSQARKLLADTATRASNSEATKKDYMTPADLRNKSWNAL